MESLLRVYSVAVCLWEYTLIESLLYKHILLREVKNIHSSELTEDAKIALGASSTLQDRGGFLQSVFSFELDFERGFKGASRKF